MKSSKKDSVKHIRRTSFFNILIQAVSVVLGLIFLNMWSIDHFSRVDLSKGSNFSLDSTTKSLVWNLDKPLYVKLFFTEGLEPPYNNHRILILETLRELQAYSKGFMHIEVVDPTRSEEEQSRAERFGVQSVPYRFSSKKRQELKQVYMGVVLIYGERQQVLPVLSSISLLEYDLAVALKELLQEQSKITLAISSGHQEPDLINGQGPLATMYSKLNERFIVVEQTLGGSGLVSEDIDVLWVVGPQKSLSLRAQYQLDQFLMRGGALGLFLTHIRANMRTLKPERIIHGLDSLLGHYGVLIKRDLIADRKENGVMRFPIQQGASQKMIPLNYPLFPKTEIRDDDHLVMRGIDTLLFPFVSSLEIKRNDVQDVQVSTWAQTSPSSGRIASVRSIDPMAYKLRAPGEEQGQWPVLVALEGAFKSFFAKKDVPAVPQYQAGTELEEPKISSGSKARLVVASSADFVPNNIAFMLNLADWMAQEDELITIRSKAHQNILLDVPEAMLPRLRLFNVFGGVALLVILGGVMFFLKRRR